MKLIRVVCFLIIGIASGLNCLLGEENKTSDFFATGFVDIGMDSLERGYYRPRFRFDFNLNFASLFLDITYHQRMERKLRGEIDYWVMVGLEKMLNKHKKIEFRINHMCRHKTLIKNPRIFELNEAIAKISFLNRKYRIGVGGGAYVGRSADYQLLLLFNMEFPRIFGSRFSLKGEFKYPDFDQLFHEAELHFSLNNSTGFFLRNTRYYGLKNITYVGFRTTSGNHSNSYIDSIKFIPSVYPFFEDHKAVAFNQFRFVFFKQNRSRLIGSIGFIAPMLRRGSFFGRFLPENMDYLFLMEYEKRIGKSLFLAFYGKYRLNIHLDKEGTYDDEVGAGLTIRNLPDFDMLKKSIRFEVTSGYNFMFGFEFGVKLGMTFLKKGLFRWGSNLKLTQNSDRFFGNIKLFVDYERGLNLRPFIGFEKLVYHDSQKPEENKFVFGVGLYKWF